MELKAHFILPRVVECDAFFYGITFNEDVGGGSFLYVILGVDVELREYFSEDGLEKGDEFVHVVL